MKEMTRSPCESDPAEPGQDSPLFFSLDPARADRERWSDVLSPLAKIRHLSAVFRRCPVRRQDSGTMRQESALAHAGLCRSKQFRCLHGALLENAPPRGPAVAGNSARLDGCRFGDTVRTLGNCDKQVIAVRHDYRNLAAGLSRDMALRWGQFRERVEHLTCRGTPCAFRTPAL